MVAPTEKKLAAVAVIAVIAVVAVATLGLGQAAFAQQGPNGQPVDPLTTGATGKPSPFNWEILGAAQYRFETGIGGGGDVQSARYGIRGTLMQKIDLDTDLTYGLAFQNFDYEFSGVTGLGGKDPWGDIMFINAGIGVRHRPFNEWEFWGGGFIQWAWENGTDFNDSFTGGVLGGATYEFSEDFKLGGGIGITSELEDSTRFFPVLELYWKINENWRMESRGLGLQRLGVELVTDLGDDWELGIGGGYEDFRFRLDDDGVGADGVGKDKAWPIWVRIGKRIDNRFKFDLFAGWVTNGELTLENSLGDNIVDQQYDEQVALGGFVTLEF